jgi:hypothetical protein
VSSIVSNDPKSPLTMKSTGAGSGVIDMGAPAIVIEPARLVRVGFGAITHCDMDVVQNGRDQDGRGPF